MIKEKGKVLVALGLGFLLLGGFTEIALPMGKGVDVPRMSKEVLKPMLGNADVIILDVRTEDEWKGGKWKIQGAVREDPGKGKKEIYYLINNFVRASSYT